LKEKKLGGTKEKMEEKENKTKFKKRCKRKVQLVWLVGKLKLVG
jgi:hypothetical protein